MCTAAGIEVAALSTTELLLMYEGCLLRTADSLSSFEALQTALPQSGLVQASSWTSCWIPTRNPGSGFGLRFGGFKRFRA